MHIQLKEDKNT